METNEGNNMAVWNGFNAPLQKWKYEKDIQIIQIISVS